jgi:hypothetical protein
VCVAVFLCCLIGMPILLKTFHQTGASAMMHSSEQTQVKTLEYFNQSGHFLSDVNDLNFQQIEWKSDQRGFYKRPDGEETEIYKNSSADHQKELGKIHYAEIHSRSDSPFFYENVYDEKGRLRYKYIYFYMATYGPYICREGKCAHSDYSIKAVPIEQTRAAFLKESGIDLYDISSILNVDIYYNTPEDDIQRYSVLTGDEEFLVDAETGKILFRRKVWLTEHGMESFPGEPMQKKSRAYLKSEAIAKEFIDNEDLIIVYEKNARDKNRFYLIVIFKHVRVTKTYEDEQPIVLFLLDHKKNKILLRIDTSYLYSANLYNTMTSRPYFDLLYEYRQYKKIKEAEEEDAAFSGQVGVINSKGA